MANKYLSLFRFAVCAIAGVGLTQTAVGSEAGAAPAEGMEFRASVLDENVFLGEMRLRLLQNDEPSGEWYVDARRKDDTLVHVGTTSLAPDVQESEILIADWDTWRPRRVVIEGDFQRRIFEADLTWDGDAISGSYYIREPGQVEKNAIAVDEAGPAGTVLRGSLLLLVPALPLADGGEFHATWFNAMGGRHEDVLVTVTDGGVVTTPAGEFDTYQARIAGGTPENVVYVTKGEQPHIVRVDVEGADMHFELLEVKPHPVAE